MDDARKESRKEWVSNNKDKLAAYARKQHHKKVNEDPEFRPLLVQRTLERRRRLREGEVVRPRGRPKQDKQDTEEEPKKAPGQPRKYL